MHFVGTNALVAAFTSSVSSLSEVPFVFHHAYALLGPGELELSTQVVAYWTNFAATGDPNTRAY